jgi:hypothetical protein
LVSIGLMALLLWSCRQPQESVTAEEAEQLALADATAALPQVPWRTKMTITTVDLGSRWRVTFTPPPGSTGDPVSVEVDKRTGKMVKEMKGPCYDHGAECLYGNHSNAGTSAPGRSPE